MTETFISQPILLLVTAGIVEMILTFASSAKTVLVASNVKRTTAEQMCLFIIASLSVCNSRLNYFGITTL
jgi:hypothetical protein